ncbi:hypothetical protein I79_018230 [Cricetulus griseus]|uniref:Uncharacterized protein n=1 Tax=Cricetulus griseus TaxID=10029 RepID=G3I455_CRIGR|nr:hypothetical protein I79_018230 [Cricetulus griseus]
MLSSTVAYQKGGSEGSCGVFSQVGHRQGVAVHSHQLPYGYLLFTSSLHSWTLAPIFKPSSQAAMLHCL